MRNYKMFAGLFVVLMLTLSGQAMAQSKIFRIPTTDTVPAGKGYGAFDFVPQAPGTGTSRIYFYNPRLVVGVSDKVEVGVNFPAFNTRASGSSSTNAYFEPNFKVKIYNNDDAGVAFSSGAILHTTLNNRSSQDSWGLVYSELSKKVKTGNYGPRFHVGPYGIVSGNQDSADGPVSFLGPRAGVILGYEQPVQPKVSIVADWFSGKNYYGYFTPGISITLPGSGLLNVGYMIGNDSWENSNATKNRYVMVYYGVTF
ncbi:MAG: hypothetical protein HY646_19845 [Acidobacteria bacterium]|nr:hypothetical protein [Acidobacteriota bacterium]